MCASERELADYHKQTVSVNEYQVACATPQKRVRRQARRQGNISTHLAQPGCLGNRRRHHRCRGRDLSKAADTYAHTADIHTHAHSSQNENAEDILSTTCSRLSSREHVPSAKVSNAASTVALMSLPGLCTQRTHAVWVTTTSAKNTGSSLIPSQLHDDINVAHACVRACACVCVRACACVRACVRACATMEVCMYVRTYARTSYSST